MAKAEPQNLCAQLAAFRLYVNVTSSEIILVNKDSQQGFPAHSNRHKLALEGVRNLALMGLRHPQNTFLLRGNSDASLGAHFSAS